MDRDDDRAVSPDRAFWLLSDETRLDLLRTVWAADDAIAFSEIRSRLDDPDSGRINYHLDKLSEHYLAKVDGGYALTQAGREVLRAVHAGSITTQPRLAPGEIDGECDQCGATLTAEYDEYGVIACPDCGAELMWNEFPPAGLEGRDTDEFARAFDRWTRARFRLAMDGICPNCAAAMTAELPTAADGEVPAVTHSCGNCYYDARVPLYAYGLYHPAAISLYDDRGVDVEATPFWQLRALADDVAVSIDAGEPWEARIRVEADERAVELVVDDELAVSAVE